MRSRVKAQALKPTLHVGKEGVNEKVVEELRRQLRKSKLVKVRVLNSCEGDRKTLGRSIAAASSSVLVDVRGSTMVFAEDERSQI
jgi:RNA-binding protein